LNNTKTESPSDVKRRLRSMSPQLQQQRQRELDDLPLSLPKPQFMRAILALRDKYNQLAKEEQTSPETE
jgi:hypothetical protein